jgi:hypothetical protein
MALRRPPALSGARTLYTAHDVARFCEVDPKTVHLWVARGLIAHTLTPGGHRRFERADVLRLLRAHDYPIAAPLTAAPARLAVLAEPERGDVEPKLKGRFELVLNEEPVACLVGLKDAHADALLVMLDGAVATAQTVGRLRALPATRHLFIACVGSGELCDAAKAAGADACGTLSAALESTAAFFRA